MVVKALSTVMAVRNLASGVSQGDRLGRPLLAQSTAHRLTPAEEEAVVIGGHEQIDGGVTARDPLDTEVGLRLGFLSPPQGTVRGYSAPGRAESRVRPLEHGKGFPAPRTPRVDTSHKSSVSPAVTSTTHRPGLFLIVTRMGDRPLLRLCESRALQQY